MHTHPSILLFRGRGLVSRLIEWQTRGDYSHAALLMDDRMIIESWQGDGVRAKAMRDWEGVDRFAVPGMSDGQWDSALRFAIGQIGKGYDYWAIVRFISRERMPDNDRWFCSELVVAALNAAGVYPFKRIAPWAVSPGLLANSPLLEPIPLPAVSASL